MEWESCPRAPYKPRDKAKVESGVQVVERWIVAALRHRTFFSLEELNPSDPGVTGATEPAPVPQTGRFAVQSVSQSGEAGTGSHQTLRRAPQLLRVRRTSRLEEGDEFLAELLIHKSSYQWLQTFSGFFQHKVLLLI